MIGLIDKFAVRLRLSLTQPINTSAVIIMALYTFFWGVFVAQPFFSVFARAPLYDVMAGVAPEWAWGLIAIVVGAFMIYGVVKHSYSSLTNGAFVGCLHWLVVGICYVLGDWANTGGLTSLTVAIYCAFIWLNLRLNKVHFPFGLSSNLPVD